MSKARAAALLAVKGLNPKTLEWLRGLTVQWAMQPEVCITRLMGTDEGYQYMAFAC